MQIWLGHPLVCLLSPGAGRAPSSSLPTRSPTGPWGPQFPGACSPTWLFHRPQGYNPNASQWVLWLLQSSEGFFPLSSASEFVYVSRLSCLK